MKIRIYLNYWRTIIFYMLYKKSYNCNLIKEDFNAWFNINKTLENKQTYSELFLLSYYLLYEKQCRNIIDYRLEGICKLIFRILFPLENNVKICMQKNKIDGGLFIYHGIATVIFAKAIGKNCTIYQQTTIGYSNGDNPTIKDNVTIYAGAKVIGGITVGNNAVVGANSVVCKDISDNCTVAGIPAKVIKTNNDDIKQLITIAN